MASPIKSFKDLGKLFGMEAPKAEQTVRLITPNEIYKAHYNMGSNNNRFFRSPAYQERLATIFNPKQAESYTNYITKVTDPSRFQLSVPGEVPAEGIVAGAQIPSDEYKEAIKNIDRLILGATDPSNYVTMPQEHSMTQQAINHNKQVFDQAERATSSKAKLPYPWIRAQVLNEAINGGQYNTESPQNFQKLFSKKGWDFLKKNLLGVPAAGAAIQYSDENEQ